MERYIQKSKEWGMQSEIYIKYRNIHRKLDYRQKGMIYTM